MAKVIPVILSGGSGTRLWPMSRNALPKQLLPLVTEQTMLQETVRRLAAIPDIEAPLIVCSDDHRFLIAEQLQEIGVTPRAILLEPEGRDTAPAAAVAAIFLARQDPDTVMLVLPADHVIRDAGALGEAVARARGAATQGLLTTFGVVPTRAETRYGYIQAGSSRPEGFANVERFVEKPDARKAAAFLADGGWYWNSGMFLFAAGRYLAELQSLQPAMASACRAALERGRSDLDFVRLDAKAFSASPALSIDYAVMEHRRHAAVVPVDPGWSDIGSWSALWDHGAKDEANNVIRGDVFTDEVTGSLIRAESRLVAAVGVSNLVIVETPDAVLVLDRGRDQEVRKVVDHLKRAQRSEYLAHRRVYRPWGWYESIDAGERFQVKRIMVKPGAKLSLQMHHHRAEHWVVVRGTAKVTRGDEVELLTEDQSTYIPLGVKHRLENPGQLPLHVIEVQSGAYLGEDDIVRFEDIYRR